jgi:hypothetical protein
MDMSLQTNNIDENLLVEVWVFNGARSSFPSAVFTKRELAEQWIEANKLEGTLTAYPLNIGIYDWVTSNGYFIPKQEDQRTSEFIARFSSGQQEHYHYYRSEE